MRAFEPIGISIHALLAESDPADRCGASYPSLFLSTLSLRRATGCQRGSGSALGISIHALLAESDRHWQTGHRRQRQFLSTLSLRRATYWATRARAAQLFLSTLSLRRATHKRMSHVGNVRISIHALLAESDAFPTIIRMGEAIFLSTLSLRRATGWTAPAEWPHQFLSTLSLRRATSACRFLPPSCRYFYPRSPCGERLRVRGPGYHHRAHFYPRSPCGERLMIAAVSTGCTSFLSTLSLRRATVDCDEWACDGIFLSTLSLRRATYQSCRAAADRTISIHALLAESDARR